MSPKVKTVVKIFRRKMKELNTFQLVKVPEGVEASVKARTVTVKGPRGSLTKAFKHLSVDIYKVQHRTHLSFIKGVVLRRCIPSVRLSVFKLKI